MKTILDLVIATWPTYTYARTNHDPLAIRAAYPDVKLDVPIVLAMSYCRYYRAFSPSRLPL